MSISERKSGNSTALVLGGHVNGYSIVKELYAEGIRDISLFDYGSSLARCSNKVTYRAQIDQTPERLLLELEKLRKIYGRIVVFATDDIQLENLHRIYDVVADFCYLPFNPSTLLQASDKFIQYETCRRIGVPYPKTVKAREVSDLQSIEVLTFPLIIKPVTRKDLTDDVFRILYVESPDDYELSRVQLEEFLKSGLEFVISECIPGDDTNIYAYTCFRSNEGEIRNEWTGKKLTQYPDNYGVVSSASNEAPEVVKEQGRLLVEALNAYGIIEPEFKYDCRDGSYKLMEVNLRSMMWNALGRASGVQLHKAMFDYATGGHSVEYKQEKQKSVHLVLLLHEIPNLIARKGYWRHFRRNLFNCDTRVWAIFDPKDIRPFLFSFKILLRMGLLACRRRLGMR